MGKTKKRYVKWANKLKNAYPRKMKPYMADKHMGELKYEATKSPYVDGYTKGITATEKLTVKNANRSRKKAMRQQSKDIIKEALHK